MIVRDAKDCYIMITQHEHANLSAQFADKWRKESFLGSNLFDDVVVGIREHDRSWIVLDEIPFWNDAKQIPYSFVDYPLSLKLHFYTYGLNEIEAITPYGCLLASLHYCSFFTKMSNRDAELFLQSEKRRQGKIKHSLGLDSNDEKDLLYHFRLLQLCDDLSLYICLNQPGSSKEDEHPWFRNGFSNSEQFNLANKSPIIASWLDRKNICFSFFPFCEEFEVSLSYKAVPKELIKREGLAFAYEQTIEEEVAFTIKE